MKVHNKANESVNMDMAQRTENGNDGFFCYSVWKWCDSGSVKSLRIMR